MKLLLFITDITHDGGTERISVSVANEFVRNGHEVTILSAFRRYPKLYYPPLPDVKIKYLVDDDYNLKKQGLFRRIGGLMQALFRVRALQKKNRNSARSRPLYTRTSPLKGLCLRSVPKPISKCRMAH